MKYETKMLLATVIASIASLFGGFAVGFVAGMKFQHDFAASKKESKAGYEVLNGSQVITHKGDTIPYNWKTLTHKTQIQK